MLEEININNFAIIDAQTVPFAPGFNVMSGETGAGKSILIDALGLQLGDRADSSWIRHGKTRCDIQSVYRFPLDSPIRQWLADNEFDNDDEEDSCQLRRTLSENGKSKCYINGIPTTVSNTKQLGEMLVDIHGQHAHQSLINPDKQLDLLDNFANHRRLLSAVKETFQTWQKLLKAQRQLQNKDHNLSDKRDLLHYQLEELVSLDLTENEFSLLANEQKHLSSANEILTQVHSIHQAINGDNSVNGVLNHIIHAAEQITLLDSSSDNKAETVSELFNQALIYIDEGRSALTHYAQSIELDPARLAEVESRMGLLHEISRKHRVFPDDLSALQSDLQEKLTQLDEKIITLSQMDANITEAKNAYLKQAQKLRDSRQKAAKKLCKMVGEKLAMLNLENARFSIDFNLINHTDRSKTRYKANGIDEIVFLFAPNPGQGEKPLHKIASGGELSRISLAIQVASVAKQTNTTLIFDEVDSGIGGATAEVVGRLLKTLSQYNQVICVTHLAQVAAFADQHIEISKFVKDGETFTQFHLLDDKTRIDELARMSGGINPDKKTQEHAKRLRDNALQFQKTLPKNI